MRRGTPRRSEQNQSFDEEIGKIPEQLRYPKDKPYLPVTGTKPTYIYTYKN
jgi:hypothetical protein